MDIWHLTVFCKVIELKSFSKAGNAVNITQPTISAHIKELENVFGCKLIDRLPKEAVPTKAGRILYDYARRIIALNDEAKSAIAHFLGNINGTLEIGGSTIPGTYILPKVIGDFKKKYPSIHIAVSIGDTEAIIQYILKGYIELAIVGAHIKEAKVAHLKILSDKMRLIIPPDHPWAKLRSISLPMLLKEPFISRERGSGTLKSIKEILSKENFNINDLNIIAEMGSTEAVKQAIKSGIGVSIFSEVAVADELKIGTLKALDIKGVNLVRHFYLVRDRQRTPSPLSSVFENFLKERLNV